MVGKSQRKSGSLMAELVVAMAILSLALMPLGYSFLKELRLMTISYQRAVAMEIIDGEMEILVAGEWHEFKPGAQAYPLQSQAARNLPPGSATLTVTGKHLRLDWRPERKATGGEVLREADAK
jgi:hypothetical protein